MVENLYKVGSSLKRLAQAKALLWQEQVEQTLTLFEGIKSVRARRFREYLAMHRHPIVTYDYYQSEGLRLNPHFAAVRHSRGIVLDHLGRDKEALSSLT